VTLPFSKGKLLKHCNLSLSRLSFFAQFLVLGTSAWDPCTMLTPFAYPVRPPSRKFPTNHQVGVAKRTAGHSLGSGSISGRVIIVNGVDTCGIDGRIAVLDTSRFEVGSARLYGLNDAFAVAGIHSGNIGTRFSLTQSFIALLFNEFNSLSNCHGQIKCRRPA